jgi:hypothetical protein
MRADERGSVAVEFAVTMPAVVLVLALCVGAVVGSAAFVQAQDSAGEVARLAARGDNYGAALSGHGDGASAEVWDAGEFRCARVTVPIRLLGASLGVSADATSCALRDVDG